MSLNAVDIFKLDPTGINDNAAAIGGMMTDLAGRRFMPQVRFPEGRYNFSSVPNLALKNLDFRGEGLVEFVHTGSGNAFTFDGNSKGPNGGGLFNLTVDNIRFRPGPETHDTLTVNSIHHSVFRVKALGAPAGNKALALYWCVCSDFYYTNSPFDDRMPDMNDCIGLWIDRALGPQGQSWQTTDCAFYSPIIESVRIGAYLQDAGGCKFDQGTIEGCTDTGLHVEGGGQNRASGTWFEGNKNWDISFGSGAKDNKFDVSHPSRLKVTGGLLRNNVVCDTVGLFGS
jgi:hypothetical protein